MPLWVVRDERLEVGTKVDRSPADPLWVAEAVLRVSIHDQVYVHGAKEFNRRYPNGCKSDLLPGLDKPQPIPLPVPRWHMRLVAGQVGLPGLDREVDGLQNVHDMETSNKLKAIESALNSSGLVACTVGRGFTGIHGGTSIVDHGGIKGYENGFTVEPNKDGSFTCRFVTFAQTADVVVAESADEAIRTVVERLVTAAVHRS